TNNDGVMESDGTEPSATATKTWTGVATGQLEVKKVLSPSNDPGRFNLQIDGITKKADASNGDTTTKQTVSPATHSVGETAGTASSLGDYTSAIECRSANGAGEVLASGSDSGPLNVSVAEGADVVCTITNTRKVGPPPTTTTTSLSGEGKTGASISVKEGAAVTDTATISGTNAASTAKKEAAATTATATISGDNATTATTTVTYNVYSDNCETEVASAGAVSVSGELVPASNPQTLAPGTYFWQASYSGDPSNEASKGQCSSEVETVSAKAPEPKPTTTTTSLSGEGKTGASISVKEGAAVTDTATISGTNAATATGTVAYKVYSDNKCTKEVASAGAVSVSG